MLSQAMSHVLLHSQKYWALLLAQDAQWKGRGMRHSHISNPLSPRHSFHKLHPIFHLLLSIIVHPISCLFLLHLPRTLPYVQLCLHHLRPTPPSVNSLFPTEPFVLHTILFTNYTLLSTPSPATLPSVHLCPSHLPTTLSAPSFSDGTLSPNLLSFWPS